MKVYVVLGYNGILHSAGAVGVAKTKEGAEKIEKDNEYQLDSSRIIEMELED